MQIMTIAVSIYTHRSMVWYGRFEAMCVCVGGGGRSETVNFF